MAVRHKHIVELQSFRGIAALVVLLHHCLFYFAMPHSFHPAAEAVFNGHASVVAFFVLSGYVLTAALLRAPIGHNEIVRYLVRRVFRLYPAIWAICILSLLLLLLINHEITVPNRSDWASMFFRSANENVKSVAASLFGLGTFLSPPMWSITVELAGSLLVLLMATTSRGRAVPMAAFVFALAVLSLVLPMQTRIAVTSSYLVHFALGASIPIWGGRLASTLGQRSVLWVALLCVVLMAGFRLVGGWNFNHFFDAPLPGLVEGTAAAVLIALLVERRDAFPLLASCPLVLLGDISYSLYLVHFPVMVALVTVGAGMLHLPVFGSWPLSAVSLMAATMLSSVGLAYISYHWIELPGIKLGNMLLSILRRSPHVDRRQIISNVSAE